MGIAFFSFSDLFFKDFSFFQKLETPIRKLASKTPGILSLLSLTPFW